MCCTSASRFPFKPFRLFFSLSLFRSFLFLSVNLFYRKLISKIRIITLYVLYQCAIKLHTKSCRLYRTCLSGVSKTFGHSQDGKHFEMAEIKEKKMTARCEHLNDFWTIATVAIVAILTDFFPFYVPIHCFSLDPKMPSFFCRPYRAFAL